MAALSRTALLSSLVAWSAGAPATLGLGVHTLLEGSLLDSFSEGVSLVLGALHKDPRPLIAREHPWEATLGFYSSLAFVPANFSVSGIATWHWYYTCAWSELFTNAPSYCVAVSTDAGATWSKPLLPYFNWTGVNGTDTPTPTNIVFRTQENTFSGSVVVDTRAGTPGDEVFLLCFEASLDGQPQRLPYNARSADGFLFEPWAAAVARGPLLNISGVADTSVALTAAFATSPGSASTVLMGGRTDDGEAGGGGGTAWCTNTSGPHRAPLGSTLHCAGGESCNVSAPGAWPAPRQFLALGYPDDDQCLDVYNFPAVSIGPDAGFGGRPSWVSLPSMMRHLPQAQSLAPIPRAATNDGFMDARLAVSRDASGWTVPLRDAFLPRGVGVRDAASGFFNGSGSDFDAGFVFVANGGVLDPDAASAGTAPSPWLWVMYWGGQTTHAGGGAFWFLAQGAFMGLLRARVRREGWVALTSPRTDTGSGWVTTVPLRLPPQSGIVLRLNAEVDASGNLTVQLQDPNTLAPLSGYSHEDCLPLRGNGIRQLIVWGGDRGTWQGGSPSLPNTSVVFNFSLVHAKLFAWELAVLADF